MAEFAELQQKAVFNQVYHVQKPDWSRDVTDASKQAFVFVLLTSSQGANIESRKLELIWRDLAARFGDVKFCQIRADMCIEGYPERNTPTVLIYRDGDIRRQLVTLRELRGKETTASGKSNRIPLFQATGLGFFSPVSPVSLSSVLCITIASTLLHFPRSPLALLLSLLPPIVAHVGLLL
jgi:hypothetical protein